MGERIMEQSLDERRLLRLWGEKGVYACRKIDLGIIDYEKSLSDSLYQINTVNMWS